MGLPENFNRFAFQQKWGDAPEGEIAFYAKKNAFFAVINSAFTEFPINASLRAFRIRKAYGVFATAMKPFISLVGDKKQAEIDKRVEAMFESVEENFREAAIQDAGEIIFIYEKLLSEQADA